jgi:hypothetical protein
MASAAVLRPLTLSRVDDGIYRVLAGDARHLGNLKLINGQWKFKAIGYGAQGELIPGGGPLTQQHNSCFARPDAAEISAALAPP